MYLPQLADLEKAYFHFQSASKRNLQANPVQECELFALYSQWTRFDSRLGEICVDYLATHWKNLNPLQLRNAFLTQPWKAVFGVLTEFTEIRLMANSELSLFKAWKSLVLDGVEKANWEQFFIGKRRIAGNSMLEDAQFAIEEYKKWGYLSREVLITKSSVTVAPPDRCNAKKFSYSIATRKQILKKLLEFHPRITTGQYLDAIGQSISKRQAERDLSASGILKLVGKTKGRYYQLSKKKT